MVASPAFVALSSISESRLYCRLYYRNTPPVEGCCANATPKERRRPDLLSLVDDAYQSLAVRARPEKPQISRRSPIHPNALTAQPPARRHVSRDERPYGTRLPERAIRADWCRSFRDTGWTDRGSYRDGEFQKTALDG
jgi:hypothetical protein